MSYNVNTGGGVTLLQGSIDYRTPMINRTPLSTQRSRKAYHGF